LLPSGPGGFERELAAEGLPVGKDKKVIFIFQFLLDFFSA